MRLYQLTPIELQQNANSIKDAIFARLQADGVIKNAEEMSGKYVVMVAEKGWLGKVLDKVFAMDNEKATYYRVLKV